MFENALIRKQNADTLEAMRDPRPGDRFHEMYSFYVYVVAVENDQVTTIEGSPPCTFPNEGKIKSLSREAFYKRFAYAHDSEKFWVTLANRGNDVSGWYAPAEAAVT